MVQGADVLGKMAGKTATEMMALGFQGADAFRGTGVSMSIGFQSSMMNNAAIRAARDAGLLSQEAIAQAGGEEALAQRMTVGSLATMQSQFGRGYNAAFIKGGQFDPASFQKPIMSGGGDFIQNAMMAAQNINSPKALLEYQAHQAKNLSKMGEMYGGEGAQLNEMSMIMSYGKYLAQNTGISTEDGFRNAAQMFDKNEATIEALLARIKNYEGEYRSRTKASQQQFEKTAIEEMQQGFFLNRAGDRIADAWHRGLDVAAKPISQFVDNMQEKSNRWVERTIDGMDRISDMADFVSGLSGRGVKKINKGQISLDVDATEYGGWVASTLGGGAGILGGLHGVIGGTVGGIAFGGKIADIIKTSYGESLVNSLTANNNEMAKAFGVDVFHSSAKSLNGYALADAGIVGKNTFLNLNNLERARTRAADYLSAINVSDEEFTKRGGSTRTLAQLVGSGAFNHDSDIDSIARGMFKGTSFAELTPQQHKQMSIELRGTVYEKMLKEAKTTATKMVGLDKALTQEGIKQSAKELEKLKNEMTNDGALGDAALLKIEQSLNDEGTALRGSGDEVIAAIMHDQKINEDDAREYFHKFLKKHGGKDIQNLRSLGAVQAYAGQEYGKSSIVRQATAAAIAKNLDYSAAKQAAIELVSSKDLAQAGKFAESSDILQKLGIGDDIVKLSKQMEGVNLGSKSAVEKRLREIGRVDLANRVSQAADNTDLQKFLLEAKVEQSIGGPIVSSSKGIEGTEKTALDTLQIQTQTNQMVLSILTAMNEELRKGR